MNEDISFPVYARSFYLFSSKLDFPINIPQNVRNIFIMDKLLEEKYTGNELLPLSMKLPIFTHKLCLPLVNFKFTQYLPEVLENQFEFNSTPSIDNSVFGFQYRQIIYDSDDALSLQSTKCYPTYLKNSIRSIVFEHEEKSEYKDVLILHDFYEHPLELLYVINSLKASCNVYIPSMHDIFLVCKAYLESEVLEKVCDSIGDFVDNFIENKFTILAEGTGALPGVIVEEQFENCKQLIVMNPIGDFRYKDLDKSDSNNEVNSGINREVILSQVVDYSETSLFSCSCDYLSILSESEIQEVLKTQKNYFYRVKYKTKHKCVLSESYAQEKKNQIEKSISKELYNLSKHHELIVHFMLFSDEKSESKLSTFSNNITVTEDEIREIIVMLNTALLEIFDVQLAKIYEYLLDIDGKPKINFSMKEFTGINSLFVKLTKKQLFEMVPALYCFSPLAEVLPFYEQKDTYDDIFMDATLQMIKLAQSEVIDVCDDDIFFLQSSHDCTMTPSLLYFYYSVAHQCQKAQVRTVLGQSHDFMSGALEIVKRIIK